MNSNQHVIIELKTNGTKCEGILVNIDKERMLIKLSSAKRISLREDGTPKEESFPELEIAKDEIKEVKIVQFEPQSDSTTKKPENNEGASLNTIPQNLQNNALSEQNSAKTYDKTDSFFDALKPMTNKEAQYESIRYNDKNCETFDLPKGTGYSGNYENRSGYGNRRGGQRRGGNRGGYRGGYQNYHNNFNYNNPNNNYRNNNFGNDLNQNPSGSYYSGSQGMQGFQQRQNQNFRGGRGGFNDFNNNRRNNFKPNNSGSYTGFPNANESNYSDQFQKQAQMFGANNSNDAFDLNQQPNFDNNFGNYRNNFSAGNRGNFGGYGGSRGGNQNRGYNGGNNNYRGRGGNRYYNNNNNRIPNPQFNSINENNDQNDQLDDEYNMSIYDKPSSSGALSSQKPKDQGLDAYDPNANQEEKSLYDN